MLIGKEEVAYFEVVVVDCLVVAVVASEDLGSSLTMKQWTPSKKENDKNR